MIAAEQFITEARKLLGTPFVHQGHTHFGVDCMGLLYVSAKQAGVDLTDIPQFRGMPDRMLWNYGRMPSAQLLEHVRRCCTRIARPVPGCLMFFQFDGASHPQHFALCAGSTIIHANQRVGRVVEHAYRGPWVRWTHSLWLLPGIEYVRESA